MAFSAIVNSLPVYGWAAVFGVVALFTIYYRVVQPLQHIPGPLLCKVTPGWMTYHAMRDTLHESILRAHDTYGDVVRVGPNTVLARSVEAVQRVLGYGQNYLSKSSDYHALIFHQASVFSETDRQAHSKKRRISAQAYSMNSVAKMEGFVDTHVVDFSKRLDRCVEDGRPLDLCTWFKFFAFDVIGDLAFGESFGLQQKETASAFAENISEGIEYTFELFILPSFLRGFRRILSRTPVPGLVGSRTGFQYVREQTMSLVSRRWERHSKPAQSTRSDILGALLETKDPQTGEKLQFQDLATNASTNVAAGSDTVTAALTGIVYHLLRNPQCVGRLMSELDNAAANGSPTLQEILSLPYMDACVKEGMRLVAPFGGPMPRLSPPGGVTISGSYIPQNTLICVMHDAVHYDHRVFPQPEMFDPARWTERQTDDMNRCFLGFSTGPRSCLGKNIALLEMKKLLFEVFTRYELCLVEPHARLHCRRYLVTKPLVPLEVTVKRRKPRAGHS